MGYHTVKANNGAHVIVFGVGEGSHHSSGWSVVPSASGHNNWQTHAHGLPIPHCGCCAECGRRTQHPLSLHTQVIQKCRSKR